MPDHPLCPYCTNDEAKQTVWSADATFYLCSHCGVVFQSLSDSSHGALAATTYSTESWGKTREEAIRSHGKRLRIKLSWFDSLAPLEKDARYLDIGAGIGVLTHILQEDYGIDLGKVTAIEPVPSIAALLQQEYPALQVMCENFENVSVQAFPEAMDVVFCLGVDYLFRDLDQALRLIRQLTKEDGRLMLQRNVFLNMPCYFGGIPIKTAEHLFGPNPLVKSFMFPDQYREIVARWFKLENHVLGEEHYESVSVMDGSGRTIPQEKLAVGKSIIFDCKAEPGYAQAPKPILHPDRARKRLRKLGVEI